MYHFDEGTSPFSCEGADYFFCEMSFRYTDESSYSTVAVILYLKFSSFLVTTVIVIVMLFTFALGRSLSTAANYYYSVIVCRAASLMYPDPSMVSRVNSSGGKDISTILGSTDGDVFGGALGADDGITLGLGEGTELYSLDGSFDGSNDDIPVGL